MATEGDTVALGQIRSEAEAESLAGHLENFERRAGALKKKMEDGVVVVSLGDEQEKQDLGIDTQSPLIYIHFGKWLKDRREDAELSQEEVAKSLGVLTSEIEKWEQAERPLLDRNGLMDLAVVLGMPSTKMLTSARLE